MKRLFFIALIISVALCLVNCSKNKIIINTTNDLNGLSIGCQSSTTSEFFLRENFPNVNVVLFQTGNDASLALKNKKIDAVMIDELPAKEIVKENKDLTISKLKFPKEEYAVAVKKGDKELLDSINNTITRIKNDGTFLKMMEAFMGKDAVAEFEVESVSSDAPRIFMGTNASFPPFEFTRGTDVVGFDIALGQCIALDCGKRFKVIDMAFNSVIEAMIYGPIDFVAAGMTITEERKKIVDFSIPYYTSHQVVIIRK